MRTSDNGLKNCFTVYKRCFMIHAKDLIYNYIKTDDEGNAEGFCTALDHVDLDVSPGEFIAILGHNGSGKSTLAKNINALLRLSGGTLYVDGKDVRDASKILEIRRSAGMIFQNPDNQIIASVVEEDVAFGPENLGVPTEEIKRRVHESLDSVGMSAYSRKSPDRLSGGQKQKVAIAGVLAMEPECIIMDEPTAMLDPKGRGEVMAAAHKLNREKNITVILITHNMEEAVDADRIFVMDRGRVVMQGTPREVFSKVDELVSYRLCVPPVTMLAHRLKQAGLDIPDAILTRQELTEALAEKRNS